MFGNLTIWQDLLAQSPLRGQEKVKVNPFEQAIEQRGGWTSIEGEGYIFVPEQKANTRPDPIVAAMWVLDKNLDAGTVQTLAYTDLKLTPERMEQLKSAGIKQIAEIAESAKNKITKPIKYHNLVTGESFDSDKIDKAFKVAAERSILGENDLSEYKQFEAKDTDRVKEMLKLEDSVMGRKPGKPKQGGTFVDRLIGEAGLADALEKAGMSEAGEKAIPVLDTAIQRMLTGGKLQRVIDKAMQDLDKLGIAMDKEKVKNKFTSLLHKAYTNNDFSAYADEAIANAKQLN